jgi:hypothetical protein
MEHPTELQQQLAEKDGIIAALRVEIAAQNERIAALEARIAELGLNSGSSRKPPSSGGVKKVSRVKSLRDPSG